MWGWELTKSNCMLLGAQNADAFLLLPVRPLGGSGW